MKKLPLVEIEWIDSHTNNDWVGYEEAIKTAKENSALRMVSCGYLLTQTADYYLLAGTISPGKLSKDDSVNLTMQIPKVCVARYTVITT